jgi:hypothetical protein
MISDNPSTLSTKYNETKYYLRKSYEQTTSDKTCIVSDHLDARISIEFPKHCFSRTPANKLAKPHMITHDPIYIEGLWRNIGIKFIKTILGGPGNMVNNLQKMSFR